MTLENIILAGQPVEVLSMPACPAPRMIEPWISDPVAESTSPWTGQRQTQRFPGNDQWGLTVTMPPTPRPLHGEWIAWLMGMRGKQRAVWMADPTWLPIASSLQGSVPVVDGTDSTRNRAGAIVLRTRGWKPNATQLLLPGEQFSIASPVSPGETPGTRLHRVILPVSADADGKAAFEVWPSLREQPADGTPLVLAGLLDPCGRQRGPHGLFCLADNKRNWSVDVTRLLRLSFPLKEYR